MQTIVNLGTGGADLNGQNGSTTSADSNDALFLDWPGDNAGNYVYNPGTSGNYLRVLDEAALDITGDIDIRMFLAADDWTPSAGGRLVSKWIATGNQRSYGLSLNSDGTLVLSWSSDGSATLSATSTVATGIADGSARWIRATLDVDNGASGRNIQFFLSDDGVTWTQLGSTVTQANVTSIFSSTSQVTFGGSPPLGTYVACKIYRVQILNGIAGTTVLDIDTSVMTSGAATSFTARTGQTVTIFRKTSGRKSVAVVSPVWLFGTDDYIEVADNALLDFDATDSLHVLLIGRQWATPANFGRFIEKWDYSIAGDAGYALGYDSSGNVGIYVDDGPDSASRRVAYGSGDLSVYHGFLDRSSNTVNAARDNSYGSPVDASSIGSLVNPRVLRIGRAIGAGGYQDFELVGVAVFRRALSTAEIDQLIAYYQARLS